MIRTPNPGSAADAAREALGAAPSSSGVHPPPGSSNGAAPTPDQQLVGISWHGIVSAAFAKVVQIMVSKRGKAWQAETDIERKNEEEVVSTVATACEYQFGDMEAGPWEVAALAVAGWALTCHAKETGEVVDVPGATVAPEPEPKPEPSSDGFAVDGEENPQTVGGLRWY